MSGRKYSEHRTIFQRVYDSRKFRRGAGQIAPLPCWLDVTVATSPYRASLSSRSWRLKKLNTDCCCCCCCCCKDKRSHQWLADSANMLLSSADSPARLAVETRPLPTDLAAPPRWWLFPGHVTLLRFKEHPPRATAKTNRAASGTTTTCRTCCFSYFIIISTQCNCITVISVTVSILKWTVQSTYGLEF